MNELVLHSPLHRLKVHIIPQWGANIRRLQWQDQQNNWIDLLDGYCHENELTEQLYFKNSKLSPFANRVAQGRYTFDNISYQLPFDKQAAPHALHGFVWAMPFEVIAQYHSNADNWAILQATYKPFDFRANAQLYDLMPQLHKGYPFAFTLNMAYKISKNGFSCHTQLHNIGSHNLPYVDGWHPYFKLQLPSIDACYLQLPPVKQLLCAPCLIPNGEIAAFEAYHDLQAIGNTTFDTSFLIKPQSNKSRYETVLYNPQHKQKITLWQNEAYGYLQLYTPPHRQSIAIEPMSAAPDAFNNQMGLGIVPPKQTWQGKYGVFVSD
jgi:aldose 1-epimerase